MAGAAPRYPGSVQREAPAAGGAVAPRVARAQQAVDEWWRTDVEDHRDTAGQPRVLYVRGGRDRRYRCTLLTWDQFRAAWPQGDEDEATWKWDRMPLEVTLARTPGCLWVDTEHPSFPQRPDNRYDFYAGPLPGARHGLPSGWPCWRCVHSGGKVALVYMSNVGWCVTSDAERTGAMDRRAEDCTSLWAGSARSAQRMPHECDSWYILDPSMQGQLPDDGSTWAAQGHAYTPHTRVLDKPPAGRALRVGSFVKLTSGPHLAPPEVQLRMSRAERTRILRAVEQVAPGRWRVQCRIAGLDFECLSSELELSRAPKQPTITDLSQVHPALHKIINLRKKMLSKPTVDKLTGGLHGKEATPALLGKRLCPVHPKHPGTFDQFKAQHGQEVALDLWKTAAEVRMGDDGKLHVFRHWAEKYRAEAAERWNAAGPAERSRHSKYTSM
eukprot:TRINITY_DN14065_c0_g1_i1.p1 TRINITY_DN14065_c0_g1~~TRINITY_DN14065_c0_g1_i1.p1  ORF type:complete len:467 (+),score=110.72 TRINITY_DN14065_c0_g1_i1:79-1401(+)